MFQQWNRYSISFQVISIWAFTVAALIPSCALLLACAAVLFQYHVVTVYENEHWGIKSGWRRPRRKGLYVFKRLGNENATVSAGE